MEVDAEIKLETIPDKKLRRRRGGQEGVVNSRGLVAFQRLSGALQETWISISKSVHDKGPRLPEPGGQIHRAQDDTKGTNRLDWLGSLARGGGQPGRSTDRGLQVYHTHTHRRE